MKVTVKRDEANPEPVEIIAQAIIDIANAAKAIDRSRLSRKALVALIHDESKIAKRTINIVLDNLSQLERLWLKPKPNKK